MCTSVLYFRKANAKSQNGKGVQEGAFNSTLYSENWSKKVNPIPLSTNNLDVPPWALQAWYKMQGCASNWGIKNNGQEPSWRRPKTDQNKPLPPFFVAS